MYDILKKKY